MSLMDLFQKPQNKQYKYLDIEKTLTLIKHATNQNVICFQASFNPGDIMDCKIGGAYVQPKNYERLSPSMTLLAQINFAQVDVPFAKEGLLQFFIDGNHEYMGLDLDDGCNQDHFKVRYLKNEDLLDYDIVEVNEALTYLPFKAGTCYQLIPQNKIQAMTYCDYRFHHTFKQLTNIDYFETDSETQMAIQDELDGFNVQMFGYPIFIQNDIREGQYEDYDILLFQLDSFRDIEWKDGGVANFFIKKKDLEKLDFSCILYNWDSY